MKKNRKELEGEVQEVKPARDKGKAHAGCRSRLPSASCACKTPRGNPRLPKAKFFGDAETKGEALQQPGMYTERSHGRERCRRKS